MRGLRIALPVGGAILAVFLLAMALIARPALGSSAAETLFVKPFAIGMVCSQVHPCDLPTALSRAGDGDTLYLAEGVYHGSGGAVITATRTITLYGGWDGTTTTPPVLNPTLIPSVVDGQNQRLGVYVGSGAAPTLDGLIITRGQGSFSGGGIASENGHPTIRGCQIVENTAPGDGGGIFVNRGSAQILNNRIIGNGGTWAAGLRIINNADVVLVGNEIRGNVAKISGGGVDIACCGGVTPRLERNLIIDNDGGSAGGGVQVRDTRVELVNNIIALNHATRGVGIELAGQATHPGIITLTHNTLIGQDLGSEGLHVQIYGQATLVNNIIAAHAVGISNTTPTSSTVTADHNLFRNASDPISGTHAILDDPLLDADFHLTHGSPALDAGTPVDVANDFDGDARPWGGYDIGADEFVRHIHLVLLLKDE